MKYKFKYLNLVNMIRGNYNQFICQLKKSKYNWTLHKPQVYYDTINILSINDQEIIINY